jgi:hypothetical protein
MKNVQGYGACTVDKMIRSVSIHIGLIHVTTGSLTVLNKYTVILWANFVQTTFKSDIFSL